LILKIKGGGAGSPERSAEKSALGHVTPFFVRNLKKQPVIRFVESRDVNVHRETNEVQPISDSGKTVHSLVLDLNK